jgi:hypothetical protein
MFIAYKPTPRPADDHRDQQAKHAVNQGGQEAAAAHNRFVILP